MKRGSVLFVSLALVGAAGVATGPVAAADPSVAGTYNAVTARRIVDTRSGLGVTKGAVAARGTLTFQAATPLGATGPSAVALTITVIAPTRNGYAVAYSGAARPGTSSVNFQAGSNVANSAVVAMSGSGIVSIYNGSSGTLNLAVDATGYWTGGTVDASTAGALHTVTPARLYDTRSGENTSLPGGADRSIAVTGAAGVPQSGVSAVVVNAAVAAPQAKGYLSVVQQPETADAVTSSIIFGPDAARADLAVVALDGDGTIWLHNGSTLPVDVVLDVVGYIGDGDPMADGSAIVSTAYRAYDDRVDNTPVPANGTRSYNLVPGGDTGSVIKAAIVTVSVASPVRPGYVVPLNGDGTAPAVSSLNHVAGQTVGQALIVPVSSDGSIALRNVSAGATNLVIDVTGFVLNSDTAMIRPAAAHRLAAGLAQGRRAAAARLGR